MTKEEVDFIGGMNMCDEISNEAYKKIMCHCEEQNPCEDAVSRKKIEKLKRWRFSYDTNTTIPKSDLFVKLTDIRALPPVKPTQRWIPVNEKLPSIKNQTNKYLVTLKDKTVCDAMFTEHNGNHWWTYNDVVAWMLLPKPYNKRLG